MPSKTHNTQAGEEQRGSSGDNIRQQEQQSRDPNKSNARDRENRKRQRQRQKPLGFSYTEERR